MELLTNSSFRRRPESMCSFFLDPGMRRDDKNGINQFFREHKTK